MIGSLINVASLATWILLPVNALFLILDGVVYSLVAYAFKLLRILIQLNFNIILEWVGPLLERVQALILVLVFVKLGMSLIQYMMDPDKATNRQEGGGALVTRIFVMAALLVSYQLIFGVLNEVSMLVLGYESSASGSKTNERFKYLSSFGVQANPDGDSGLLSRLIFGETVGSLDEFGGAIAASTLNLFLYDRSTSTSDATTALAEAKATGNFMGITSVVTKIDITVEYFLPLLSHAVGAYLLWTIVMIAIEVGIRAFKLIVLQVMAPIAIIAYIDPKTKQQVTDHYVKAYLGTYVSVFIRIASLYIMIAVISMIWNGRGSIFAIVEPGKIDITNTLLMVLLIIAGFKFVQKLPKLLEDVFGLNIDGGSSGSFKGFMRGAGKLAAGAVGFGVGTVAGASSAVAAGASAPGSVFNSLKSGLSGASAGFRGNSIKDSWNNISRNNQNARNRALNLAEAGGLRHYAAGAIQSAVGVGNKQDLQISDLERQKSAYDSQEKALDAYDKAQLDAIKSSNMSATDLVDGKNANALYDSGYEKIQLGESADLYATKMLDYDKSYQAALADYEMTKLGKGKHRGNNSMRDAQVALVKAKKEAEARAIAYYNQRKENAYSAEVVKAREHYNRTSGNAANAAVDKKTERQRIKDGRASYDTRINQIKNKQSYQNTHRNNNRN